MHACIMGDMKHILQGIKKPKEDSDILSILTN